MRSAQLLRAVRAAQITPALRPSPESLPPRITGSNVGVAILASAQLEEQQRILRLKQETVASVGRFLDDLSPLRLGATRRYVSGQPADVLRRMANEQSFDLVVMGRVGAGGLRRVLLGSTAERLVRKLRCALLLTSPHS